MCDFATRYEHVRVTKEYISEKPPVFLGLILIHDKSYFESYSNFFNHLRAKLRDTDKTKVAFGSEEELAFVNAIHSAFPESTYLICRRYLYQNTKQNGCAYKADRRNFKEMVFNALVSVLIQNNRK